MTNAITVSKNLTISKGVFDCQNYQLTGNTSGTLSLASGTGLVLGLPSSSTNISFPTNFTNAHTSLNSNSTVVFQANTTSQSIPVTRTYGNVVVGGGSLTKTPSVTTTALTLNGNLTVCTSTTLSMTTDSIKLTGSLINNGTLSFTTGPLFVGGNFTNNGTFTCGTGTVTFNGSGAQSLISANSAETFQNLTVNGTSNLTTNCHLNINAINYVQSGGTMTVQ